MRPRPSVVGCFVGSSYVSFQVQRDEEDERQAGHDVRISAVLRLGAAAWSFGGLLGAWIFFVRPLSGCAGVFCFAARACREPSLGSAGGRPQYCPRSFVPWQIIAAFCPSERRTGGFKN